MATLAIHYLVSVSKHSFLKLLAFIDWYLSMCVPVCMSMHLLLLIVYSSLGGMSACSCVCVCILRVTSFVPLHACKQVVMFISLYISRVILSRLQGDKLMVFSSACSIYLSAC